MRKHDRLHTALRLSGLLCAGLAFLSISGYQLCASSFFFSAHINEAGFDEKQFFVLTSRNDTTDVGTVVVSFV